ncbi:hypothetical protein ACHQM5_026794 [Ranunculus cassubicifolius]
MDLNRNSDDRRNSTLICAPIMGDTVDEMLSLMNKAEKVGVDVVEIRLDYLKDFSPKRDIEILISKSPLPTLITYRPTWEGGEYEGDESMRLNALRLAMELGADYIDVELQVAAEFINSIREKKPEKLKIIVSSHNYHRTPSAEEIGSLVEKIKATGADIVKIATTALDISDVARVFQMTANSPVPVIGLVMTEKGLMSRILCPKYGGYLTFGTLEAGKVSAPGQPTVADLLNLFNFRQIGPDTKIVGLIGNPVSHSKAPFMFNKAFNKVGFNGVYLPLLVDNIKDFLETYASSPDFAGFSCTIPHKEEALKCCDEVDPIARAIGAVNTIIRRPSDGKLIGYNTDYIGAISAIEIGLKGVPLAGKRFVVIGAGGTGKALAYGAKAKGANVVIANRTYSRAKELADRVGAEAVSLDDLAKYHPEDGTILANTTSVGMQPKINETPIPKNALKNYTLVFDAVYTPKMTRLLLDAEETGCTVVTGLDMLVLQAFEQYARFTGLPVPEEFMWETMSGY